MRRGLIILAALLVPPSLAHAQIPNLILNPTAIEFDPSPDHAVTNPLTGEAKVASYEARYFLNGQSGSAPAFTVPLGKPVPNAQGKIVALNVFGSLLPNTAYQAVIVAIGPGGTGASAPSNPFGTAAPHSAPAPPGRPIPKSTP